MIPTQTCTFPYLSKIPTHRYNLVQCICMIMSMCGDLGECGRLGSCERGGNVGGWGAVREEGMWEVGELLYSDYSIQFVM